MLVLVMGSLFGVNDAEIKVKTETTNKRVEISSTEIVKYLLHIYHRIQNLFKAVQKSLQNVNDDVMFNITHNGRFLFQNIGKISLFPSSFLHHRKDKKGQFTIGR